MVTGCSCSSFTSARVALRLLCTKLHMSGSCSSSPPNRQRNKTVSRNTNIFYVLQNLLQNICLCRGYYNRLSLFFNPKENDIIISHKLQVLTCDMVLYLNSGKTFWRSQGPRGLRRRSSAARLLRSWVRIPPGAWMFVCFECCVLSVRGLYD